MSCVFGNPLTDEDLIALIDGEASPEVEAHLESCPFCQQRAESLAQIDALMSLAFHSSSPELTILREPKRKVVATIQPSVEDHPQVAGMDMNDDEGQISRRFNIEGAEIDLFLIEQGGQIEITGLVSAVKLDEQAHWEGAIMTLTKGPTVLMTTLLDRNGRFGGEVPRSAFQKLNPLTTLDIVIRSTLHPQTIVIPITDLVMR